MGIRIQQLPDSVANQIAAGEVIERPASVVKELLENALDAQATEIQIEIGFGGLNQIKISDNGTGIIADDLLLAIAPHATSKITSLHDLSLVTSMGFRGEALASIASVSKFILSSKPAIQEHAMRLQVAKECIQVLPCARSQGTTVEVSDLFFNTPVRKKFLKSERLEYQAIEMVVKRFALSEPKIAITLKHNNKLTLQLPAASCEKTQLLRIKKIMGKTFVEESIFIDVERAGMRLQGWISQRTYQRSQSDKQWIYLNRRMVKDKLLTHALKRAYENQLHPGRYPTCVLYLTIPVEQVDVNVHPTKHEVRFQQSRLVHDFIVSQLEKALSPGIEYTKGSSITLSEPKQLFERNIEYKRPIQPALPAQMDKLIILNQHFALLFFNHHQTYLIDLMAIHQYRMQNMLRQESLPLLSRPLLVPIVFSFNKINYDVMEKYQMLLEQYGINFDFISENTIRVRSIPQCLPLLNLRVLLESVDISSYESRRPATCSRDPEILDDEQAHCFRKDQNGPREQVAGRRQVKFPQTLEYRTILDQEKSIIELLIQSESFDATQLSFEEKSDLVQYLEKELPLLSNHLRFCRLLDITNCREVINE